MSISEVKVPDIGDFQDVEVLEVICKEGQSVAVEDPLITLESDKATMDVPSCLLYTSPSPRDGLLSRMPSSA